MKHVFIALLMLFMTALTTFTSCSKEENESYEPIYSPIGNTYETSSLSLYFESADTISFQCLDPWLENIKGKAAYRFNGALLYIKNPYGYGVRPNPEEVNNPYFFNFWGIVKKDRIDNVSYLFIGPNERQQFMSGNCTFYLIKDK